MANYTTASDHADCNARVESQLAWERRWAAADERRKRRQAALKWERVKREPREQAPLVVHPPARAAVIAEVAASYNLCADDLMKRTRLKAIAEARQVAMRELRARCGMSYPAIGIVFGLNHSTVLYGVRKVSGDADFMRRYNDKMALTNARLR